MAVTPSTIIDPETAALDDQLWGVPSAFIVDWSVPVQVRNQYTTDVKYAGSMVSSREGLRGKPKRVVTASVLGMEQIDIKLIRAAMFRQAQAKSLCPIFCDQSWLDTAIASGVNVLPCVTDYRRFHVGARVLIISPVSRTGRAVAYEVLTITEVNPTNLHTSTNTVRAYAAGSRVYPLIEGRPVVSPQTAMEAESVGRWSVAVQEDVGVSQLPSQDLAFDAPFGSAYEMPIFNIRCDWKDRPTFGVQRSEITTDVGITTISQMKGLRPVVVGSLFFEFVRRKDAWLLCQFWQACRGRLFPFILPIPTDELLLLSVGGSAAAFAETGQEKDWSFVQFVLFEKADGSQLVLKVQSWLRTGSGDLVTFADAVPGGWSTTTIVRSTFAIAVCWDSDEMVEVWSSDETMSVSLAVREFPFDEDVDIDIPNETTGVDLGEDPDMNDPDDIDPVVHEFQQLRGCDGDLADLFVPAVPAPPDYLYLPSTDQAYAVEHTNIAEDDLTGPVVTAWQEIPEPPDDPGNPSWVPLCGQLCPDTAGSYTSWYQFALAVRLRAEAAGGIFDYNVDEAVDEAQAGQRVRAFIYDAVPYYSNPTVAYTAPINWDWVWTRAAFATQIGLAGSSPTDFDAMTKAQAFVAFQNLWTRTWGHGQSVMQCENKQATGATQSAADANYAGAAVTAGFSVGGMHSYCQNNNGSVAYSKQRIKIGIQEPLLAGLKAYRFYQRNETLGVSTGGYTAIFDDNGDVSSPYSIAQDQWSQISGGNGFAAVPANAIISDWIGNLSKPTPAPFIPGESSYRGYQPTTSLSSDNIRILVGYVFRCILGTPHF